MARDKKILGSQGLVYANLHGYMFSRLGRPVMCQSEWQNCRLIAVIGASQGLYRMLSGRLPRITQAVGKILTWSGST
jgi:hypothetical protein